MSDLSTFLGWLAGLALVAAMIPHQVRNIRIVNLLAGALGVAYFLAAHGIGIGFAFALAFLLVNAARLLELHKRARSGAMTGEEQELFDHVMQIEDPRQQSRLRDLMVWQDVAAGTQLIGQGEADPPLIYVASGKANIMRDGEQVGECGESEFLGEMSHVSGHRASASVIADETMRIARFDRDALGQLARTVPEVGKAIDLAVNRSLAAKVVRMNKA